MIRRKSVDGLVALLLLSLYAGVLFSLRHPVFLDDGLRHLAMARVMRESGLFIGQAWGIFLERGLMSTIAVDPWYLSNLLLVPVAHLPPQSALAIFTWVGLALLTCSFLFVMRRWKIPQHARAVLLFLLLVGDPQFLGRMFIGRPFALMTSMTILFLWALLERRWIIMAILVSVAALLSQLFTFFLLFGGMAILWHLISRRYCDAGFLLLALAAGCAFGLLLHPQTLAYVSYLSTVFLKIPFLKAETGLSPEMASGLFDISAISVLLGCSAAVLGMFALEKRMPASRVLYSSDLAYHCVIVLLLTLMFSLWVRTIDFLWPVLLLLLARLTAMDPMVWSRLKRAIGIPDALHRILCAVIALHVLIVPVRLLMDDASHDLSPYRAIERIPSGSHVLNFDWDRFSIYVYLRPDLHYATGIDPSFTYVTDPKVADDLRTLKASSQQVSDEEIRNALELIFKAYPSQYVMLYRDDHQRTIDILRTMPDVSIIAESQTIFIAHL